MFTILVRTKKTNREILYLADEIEFHEEDGLRFHSVNGNGSHLGIADKEDDYRDVFVMNENGQTVARYLL